MSASCSNPLYMSAKNTIKECGYKGDMEVYKGVADAL